MPSSLPLARNKEKVLEKVQKFTNNTAFLIIKIAFSGGIYRRLDSIPLYDSQNCIKMYIKLCFFAISTYNRYSAGVWHLWNLSSRSMILN